MYWLISLEQFEELATSKPSPPYFLLLVGLLITLTCAIPFVIVVSQRMEYWSKHFSPDTLPSGGRLQVVLPFSGAAAGVCIFLASGLEVLGVPVLPSLIFSLILTFLVSYLAWSQLGRLLSRRLIRSYFDQSSDFSTSKNKADSRKSKQLVDRS